MTGDQPQNFNNENKTNYFPGYEHKNKSDSEIDNKKVNKFNYLQHLILFINLNTQEIITLKNTDTIN